MKVKEIIKSVALLIGDSELHEYVESKTGRGRVETEYNNLLTMVNLVVNETSAYIPIFYEEEINTSSGKVYYSTLQKKIIKVYDVYNEKGESLKFNNRLDYLEVDSEAKCIKYSFVPDTLTENSEIPFAEKTVSSSVIVYGVTANYCIYQNRFDEASLWNERYANSIKNLVLTLEAENVEETNVKEVKNAIVKGRNFL